MSPPSCSRYSTKQTSSAFNPCKKQSVFTSNMQCRSSGAFSGYSGLPPFPPFQANTLFTSTLPPPPPPPPPIPSSKAKVDSPVLSEKIKFLLTLFQKAGLVQEGTISVRQCRQHGGNHTLCPTHWHTMSHPLAHYVPPTGSRFQLASHLPYGMAAY